VSLGNGTLFLEIIVTVWMLSVSCLPSGWLKTDALPEEKEFSVYEDF
jgi:hypothetical protein